MPTSKRSSNRRKGHLAINEAFHQVMASEEIYTLEIGKGVIRKEGKDVTIIAVSLMVHEAMKAAENLALEGLD